MSKNKEQLKKLILGILNLNGATQKVKLAKLILFSDIEHYKKTGKSITELHYIKLHKGPVVSFFDEIIEEGENDLWDMSVKKIPVYEKGMMMNQYDYQAKTPHDLQSEEEETIKKVIEKYGKMTGTQLSAISHNLPAWLHSELNEPIHISELAIDKEDEYFAFIDILEELDEQHGDSDLENQLSRRISEG